MPEQNENRRPIRSYVLRERRLTAGQQRAFDNLWPRWGIDFNGQRLELPALFGNRQPVFLEIGFGNGESLAQMAASNPCCNYLGVEVHRPGVGHLLLEIERRNLGNLRLIRHDAVEVLQQGLDSGCLDGVYLFFPDPWHKQRHHKRRILRPALIAQLARVIRRGGVFHAATDWSDYAQQMMTLLSAAEAFENCAATGQFTPRPEYRPLTRFEQRGHRLGHGVWDLVFRRC